MVFSGHPLVQRLQETAPGQAANGHGPAPSGVGRGRANRSDLPLAAAKEPVTRGRDAEATDAPGLLREVDGSARAAAPVVQPASDDLDIAQPATSEAPEVDAGKLFDELYPRMLDEIRWDLRVQRERAGLLGDPL